MTRNKAWFLFVLLFSLALLAGSSKDRGEQERKRNPSSRVEKLLEVYKEIDPTKSELADAWDIHFTWKRKREAGYLHRTRQTFSNVLGMSVVANDVANESRLASTGPNFKT